MGSMVKKIMGIEEESEEESDSSGNSSLPMLKDEQETVYRESSPLSTEFYLKMVFGSP